MVKASELVPTGQTLVCFAWSKKKSIRKTPHGPHKDPDCRALSTCLFAFFQLEFLYHKSHHCYVYSSVASSIFVKLYNHHQYLILEHVLHLKAKTCPCQQSLPTLPLPQPRQHVFPASMDWLFQTFHLKESYSRWPSVPGFFRLAQCS